MTWMEWIQKIDFAVLDWIQQHIKGDFLDFLMPLITALGNLLWIAGSFFAVQKKISSCRNRFAGRIDLLLNFWKFTAETVGGADSTL